MRRPRVDVCTPAMRICSHLIWYESSVWINLKRDMKASPRCKAPLERSEHIVCRRNRIWHFKRKQLFRGVSIGWMSEQTRFDDSTFQESHINSHSNAHFGHDSNRWSLGISSTWPTVSKTHSLASLWTPFNVLSASVCQTFKAMFSASISIIQACSIDRGTKWCWACHRTRQLSGWIACLSEVFAVNLSRHCIRDQTSTHPAIFSSLRPLIAPAFPYVKFWSLIDFWEIMHSTQVVRKLLDHSNEYVFDFRQRHL